MDAARYAARVVRSRAGHRYLATLGFVVIALGCGGTPTPGARTIARGEPTSASDNQQGHPLSEDAEAEEETVTPPDDQPSIAGVYLWCNAPTGPACRFAAAVLGTNPKDASGIPASLMAVEDLPNDCEEPTITAIGGRLTHAFQVEPTGWRDQGGSYLDVSLMSDMYSAAGCINDGDTSRPIAKISAAAGASPRLYLVRVWDGQPPPRPY
jgi:hypothetical protein